MFIDFYTYHWGESSVLISNKSIESGYVGNYKNDSAHDQISKPNSELSGVYPSHFYEEESRCLTFV